MHDLACEHVPIRFRANGALLELRRERLVVQGVHLKRVDVEVTEENERTNESKFIFLLMLRSNVVRIELFEEKQADVCSFPFIHPDSVSRGQSHHE